MATASSTYSRRWLRRRPRYAVAPATRGPPPTHRPLRQPSNGVSLEAPAMSTDAAPDWRDRQVSAAEAVSAVRPGDRVFVGSACATPRTLVEALEQLARPGVVLVHFLTDRVGTGDPPRTNYRHRVFYVGRDVRDLRA